MKLKAGLWIDHSNAKIVLIDENNENVIRVESNIKKNYQSPSGRKINNSVGNRDFAPDDMLEREFTEHMKAYYKQVISNLRNVDEIFIFGPGESKRELAKYIEKNNVKGIIKGIENVDKLTDRQMMAKVRDYYSNGNRKTAAKKLLFH